MSEKNPGAPDELTANIKLSIYDEPVHLLLTVSKKPTNPTNMLPLFRSMSEKFVGLAVGKVESAGFEIACTKGCGACCRQMVPISQFEARRLRDFVNEMPEPRKTEILERFEKAVAQMTAAGLIDGLRHPENISKEEYRAFGLNYFQQGVACPFLEEESCSIHPERPLVCREYLVVSPAENCQRKNDQPIQVIDIPIEMSKAVECFNEISDAGQRGWVPLILAMEWADAHPDELAERPGTELLRELFENISGRNVPQPTAVQ